jgi:methionyl-tRNA synthetase
MSSGLRSFCGQALEAGLSDVAVTHYNNWGVQVTVEGFEGQTIFTWLEEAGRYLAYALHLDGDWKHFWKSDETSAVQCFGFDNSFYYAVFMPALLMAYDNDVRLPAALIMNEFCLIGDAKASTSRRNAVSGRDLLTEVPADALRFYLAARYPEKERTSFSATELIDYVNRELVGQWQPWLEELAARMRWSFGNRIPASGAWAEQHGAFLHRLETLTMDAAHAYDVRTFSPQRAVLTLRELVREARHFANSPKSWRSQEAEELQTVVALELVAAKLLALLSAPILPQFAERLWRELGYEFPIWNNGWEDRPSWIPEGQKIHGLATKTYFATKVFH